MNEKSTFNFVQQLNPIMNKMEWKIVDSNYDYNQEIATSCYGDMLHDEERNQKFGLALERAIQKFHKAGKKAHVLDIGTGTGLLSMLAVKYGADSVVACEAFLPMANCALDVIKQNKYFDNIKLVKKHSTSLTVGKDGDLKQKANILVSEVFDTELIGEGAIKTFNHAHEFLLEKDCIVIPSSGTIYAQIIESDMALKWNQVQDWKDKDEILVNIPDDVKKCPGAAAVHDIQLSQFPQKYFKPLSQVIPVFRFDWSGKKTIPTHRQVQNSLTAISTGKAQVVFMWWDLVMDTDGDIMLSCAPVWEHPNAKNNINSKDNQRSGNPAINIPWRDHWMQAVYFLSQEISVKSGNTITLSSSHDEFSFWFQITNKLTESEPNEKEISQYRPVCSCSFHFLLSRTRIGAINDERRRKLLLSSLKKIITPDSVCVYLGDVSLIPVVIAKLGAKRVYILENTGSICNIFKKLSETNAVSDKVSICSNFSQIADAVIKSGEKSVLILSEPSFRNAIVPWDNLSYWYLKDEFVDSANKLEKIIPTVFPKRGKLRACAVQFDDLWKISTRLNFCEGFLMNHFDDLIQSAKIKAQSFAEAQPLWEYPGIALAAPITLFDFNFDEDVPQAEIKKEGELEFSWSCRCDGVALWMEYDLSEDFTLTSGPVKNITLNEYISWDMFERQGVHLFGNDVRNVDKGDKLHYQVGFEPGSAEFRLNFYFGSQSC